MTFIIVFLLILTSINIWQQIILFRKCNSLGFRLNVFFINGLKWTFYCVTYVKMNFKTFMSKIIIIINLKIYYSLQKVIIFFLENIY